MKMLRDMTEPELAALLNAMGRAISTTAMCQLVEKPMFCLLLFNDPQIAQYVANCEREDIIKAMRETADRLEGRDDVVRQAFGATGSFPDGSVHENDEGELRYGLTADSMNGVVLVDFGKPVRSIGWRSSEARQFARAVLAKADQLDGGIGA